MEPFFTVNMPFGTSFLPKCDIPFRIASISELEQWVTVDDISAGRLLLDFMKDQRKNGHSLNDAVKGHQGKRNEVLHQGWESYPWRDSDKSQE